MTSAELAKIRARFMLDPVASQACVDRRELLEHVDTQNGLLLRAWSVMETIVEHEESMEEASLSTHIRADLARTIMAIEEAIDVPNDGINARFALRFVGLAGGQSSAIDGQYLRAYDVAMKPEGGDYSGGDLDTTPDLAQAKTGTLEELMAIYRTVSPHGARLDGKPDRPLTVFTVEFERVKPAQI